MNQTKWILATAMALGLVSVGIAQQAPDCTAEEAGIPTLLRMSAAMNKGLGPEEQATAKSLRRVLPGAVPKVVLQRDGRVTCGAYSLRLHNADTGATGEGFVIYAWPTAPGSGTRSFVVTARGEVLATDGASAVYDGKREPEWSAAVKSGAAESLEHVLTALGKGMDGQMWMPVTAKPTSAELRVPGAEGCDEGELAIVVGPKCWFGSEISVPLEDARFPAGMSPVGADGRVRLSGIAASGMHLGLFARNKPVSVRVELGKHGKHSIEVSIDGEQLGAARHNANEAAAIATLRNISSAEAQCQAAGVIDVDRDGNGEYGFFAELAGAVVLRGPAGAGGDEMKMNPPILSQTFAKVRSGRAQRSGYVFQIFLPGKDGAWVPEADAGGAAGVVIDHEAAEQRWRCYAWPLSHGRSGKRAFVVDEAGDILANDNADGRYDGDQKPVKPDAAYFEEGKESKLAVRAKGGDGCRWTAVH